MDTQSLVQVLQTSMSPNPAEIKASETQLTQLESQSAGQLLMRLLEIVFQETANVSVRQAGAIYSKNLLKRRWSPKLGEPDSLTGMSEAEKESVRLLLVEATCGSNATPLPRAIQVQMNAIISYIADLDFPKSWPTLLPSLVQTLNSSPSNDLRLNALNVVCSVFRKYKTVSRSNEILIELQYLLPIFQETHLSLFKTIVPAILLEGVSSEVLLAAEHVLDLFYSLNVIDIPEFYQDNIESWMNGFLAILGTPNLAKIKTLVCANLALYADKYQEVFEPYVPGSVKAVWGLLTILDSNDTDLDQLVAGGIKFLSSTANTRWSNSPFEEDAALIQICEKLVLPNIQLRDSDIELFTDNPDDYIRRDLLNADSDTRRRSAIDLVRSLSKFYEDKTTHILLEYVKLLLGNVASVRAKDACIQLVTAMASKGETRAHGVSQVNSAVDIQNFYMQHLRPEIANLGVLTDERAVLIASCLKFVILFRSQLKDHSVDSILALIKPETPKVLASYASHCAYLLLASSATAADYGKTIQSVMQTIMSSGDQNEYHMKLVYRLISQSPAGNFLPQLVALITTFSANPMNAVFTHYLFEATAVSVSATSGQQVIAPLCDLLEKNVSEYIPYAFQILGLVLEKSTARIEVFAHLFTILMNEELWKNPSLGPALVRIMTAYCAKWTLYKDLMTPNIGILMTTRFATLFNSAKFESAAFDLLNSIVSHVEPEILAPNLGTVFMSILTKIHSKRTDKLVKSFGVFMAVLLVSRTDLAVIVGCLDKVQQGLWIQVIKDLWMSSLATINLMNQSERNKKVTIIAIAKLLSSELIVRNEPVFLAVIQATSNAICVNPGKIVETTANVVTITTNDESHDFEVGYAKLSSTAEASNDFYPNIPGDGVPELKQALRNINAQVQQSAPQLAMWANNP